MVKINSFYPNFMETKKHKKMNFSKQNKVYNLMHENFKP